MCSLKQIIIIQNCRVSFPFEEDKRKKSFLPSGNLLQKFYRSIILICKNTINNFGNRFPLNSLFCSLFSVPAGMTL